MFIIYELFDEQNQQIHEQTMASSHSIMFNKYVFHKPVIVM